jgi:peptidoglycan/xylan/chitin deacetylase (PgdA/CDA1 family)
MTRSTYDVQRTGKGTREVSEDDGFGPDGLPRALVLTFDNLGEANELERGTWSAGAQLGRHPSVTVALPRLLDELDARELSATFFVEAINCELNPDAVLEIARRGHELGMHGWRHEAWAELSAEEERDALTRGMKAFATLGIDVAGFRPPGGGLTPRSASLLREAGLRWCSPAGGGLGLRDGLVYVPFDWPFVDAYHLMSRFSPLRVSRGEAAEALEPGALAQRLSAELDALACNGGQQTLILHPFLMVDESWCAGARVVLGRIRRLADAGRLWVVPGGRFADWLRGPTQSRVPDQ